MYRILPVLTLSVFLLACEQGGSMSGDTDGSSAADSAADSSNQASANTSASTSSAAGALETDAQRRSYALGMDIGNSLKGLPVELETDYVAQGLKDTIAGGKTRLSQEEATQSMQSFVSALESAQAEQADATAADNSKKGASYREEFKSEDGVKSTDSGLLYRVETEGEGASPSESDSVTVHYEGKLVDGTVFDSSRERGEPVTFPVNAVIPGWTEALQMMKEGAQYTLVIPPELAYGDRGAGARIGPNETLTFDVELIKVLEGNEGQDDS
jgi:FKBP-type peptidyl-prolyl cis-trans isomerase